MGISSYLSLSSGSDPSQGDNGDSARRGEGHVVTEYRPTLKEPSLYRVMLLNDDFTPMDFVILVLKKFFHRSDAEATRIMLEVHTKGSGLAGIYTHEVAETKTYLVNEFSKASKHPLKCTMQKE